MNKKRKNIRNKIIYKIWEEYKSEYTAEQLVKELRFIGINVSLQTFYRILKKESLKRSEQNK